MTRVYALYNNDSPTFQAYGAGSEIELPGVTGISGLNDWLYINARTGGEVDVSQIASITNSYVNISADGTDTNNDASTIDLSALTIFTESGGPYGDLSATNGGDVIAPLLTAPIGLNITIAQLMAARHEPNCHQPVDEHPGGKHFALSGRETSAG